MRSSIKLRMKHRRYFSTAVAYGWLTIRMMCYTKHRILNRKMLAIFLKERNKIRKLPDWDTIFLLTLRLFSRWPSTSPALLLCPFVESIGQLSGGRQFLNSQQTYLSVACPLTSPNWPSRRRKISDFSDENRLWWQRPRWEAHFCTCYG